MKPYALAAGAAVSILLASCGSSAPTTPASEPASSPAAPSKAAGGSDASSGGIVISNFQYSGTMTVKPGAEVTVTNKDTQAHTVTAKVGKAFDSGNIAAGGNGKFTAPKKAGSYPFGCTYHSKMAGTLIVKA